MEVRSCDRNSWRAVARSRCRQFAAAAIAQRFCTQSATAGLAAARCTNFQLQLTTSPASCGSRKSKPEVTYTQLRSQRGGVYAIALRYDYVENCTDVALQFSLHENKFARNLRILSRITGSLPR
ncbi:MAG: hypothetical protein V7L04_17190 [Nostoc sp.]